jgi:hypothetical protein
VCVCVCGCVSVCVCVCVCVYTLRLIEGGSERECVCDLTQSTLQRCC